MNQELIKKIEEMFQSGKITQEQKELLEKAFEQKNQQDSENLKITSVIETDKKELHIKLLNEDVIIQGDSETNQVCIIEGSELVELIKSDNKIIIQSKKENIGFIRNLINQHEIIKQKNGIIIQQRATDDEVVIMMPAFMISFIKTVSGDIDLKNVQSEISLKSVSGDICVTNHQGSAVLSSISGDLQIRNHQGSVELVSKSGDIDIENSEMDGLIKTYSGDITIEDSSIHDLEMAVFSGDIDVRKTKADGEIQCKTFSGDVSAKLLAQSAYITGITASGDIIFQDSNQAKYDIANKEFGNPTESLQIRIKTTSGDGDIQLSKI